MVGYAKEERREEGMKGRRWTSSEEGETSREARTQAVPAERWTVTPDTVSVAYNEYFALDPCCCVALETGA